MADSINFTDPLMLSFFGLFGLMLSLAQCEVIEIVPGQGSQGLFAALAAAKPGDEIVVKAGTYVLQQPGGSWYREINVNGEPTNPIVIRAAEGETVVLQGTAVKQIALYKSLEI